MKIKQKNILYTVISLIVMAIHLIPFYIVLVVSLKPASDLSSRWIFPKEISLKNYLTAIREGAILKSTLNSIIITVATVLILLIISSLAAYPLARVKSKFTSVITSIVLGVMMVPNLTILVPLYKFMIDIKALSSYWGIVVIFVTYNLSIGIFMFKNFIHTIPKAMDESSMLDGCTSWGTFIRIIFPQLKPVTASVAILVGVKTWNDYSFSLYFLQSSKRKTIILTIAGFFNEYSTNLNAAASAAILGAIPIIVIYLVLQKYFVSGITSGAIKG